MNFISNLTCGQIFGVIIGGFMILVILELFRRDTMIMSWPKVAIRWIFRLIGFSLNIHGLSELYSGRWMGIMWISLGTGIVYMVDRERIEVLKQKRAEKDEQRE